ncbi:MAG: CheR family methyltransferase [Chloroflexota bacterium]
MATLADQEYEFFCRKIRALTGLDLSSYKKNQMDRRLRSLMQRLNVDGYSAYGRLLERDEARLKEFRDFITINVSEFFRNPDKFDELRTRILPELLRASPRLKLFSAGCSNGSEPYTLAIILEELTPGRRHEILAVDIDDHALAVARAGVYTANDLKNVNPNQLRRHFTAVDGGYRAKDDLRSRIRFERGDLLADRFEDGFDLIVCRNVVIYFTDAAKTSLYSKFHAALKPGGVLFVGGTESIFNAKELGFESVAPFFYRKPV